MKSNFFKYIFILFAICIIIFAIYMIYFKEDKIENKIEERKQAKINKNSPRLTVYAKVVAKRNHYHKNSSSMMSSSRYYATFEVESGDRFELQVPEYEYGLMIVGDTGELFFQGTRFLSFTRK